MTVGKTGVCGEINLQVQNINTADRLGAFFQKEMFIPRKIANRPKFLDLVNYQHSQNLQDHV